MGKDGRRVRSEDLQAQLAPGASSAAAIPVAQTQVTDSQEASAAQPAAEALLVQGSAPRSPPADGQGSRGQRSG
eukprot:10016207-Lingulodinium_polyedra.AAC.1